MSSSKRAWTFVATLLLGAPAFAAAACGPPPEPSPPAGGSATTDATTTDTPTSEPTATATGATTAAPTSAPTAEATSMPELACKLPAPVKSGDACKTDADCGVSDPCHAHACVAKAKSHPPDKSTMCTRMMDCRSADANACGCLDGVCALYARP